MRSCDVSKGMEGGGGGREINNEKKRGEDRLRKKIKGAPSDRKADDSERKKERQWRVKGKILPSLETLYINSTSEIPNDIPNGRLCSSSMTSRKPFLQETVCFLNIVCWQLNGLAQFVSISYIWNGIS
ncbi:hypothetical protein CDAR_235131 [Caerostris darwini]|uniref:Uncharacterized protein n=1 Tax=Caerostris darwini TaxID=1538125 RepID=A0AAV4MR81_9ARAC|nr:hypothetical protein CDAR_235131 [Caerostris darwini]